MNYGQATAKRQIFIKDPSLLNRQRASTPICPAATVRDTTTHLSRCSEGSTLPSQRPRARRNIRSSAMGCAN